MCVCVCVCVCICVCMCVEKKVEMVIYTLHPHTHIKHRFIEEDAAHFTEKFGCKINPTARIADEDGLQLANVCTKMIARRQFTESAKTFLEILGYSDRIGF